MGIFKKMMKVFKQGDTLGNTVEEGARDIKD